MPVDIKFCGAAGVVTGSSYLVTSPHAKFLVDCGLFQGTKTVKELNYGGFGFAPEELSFVLLTHAHIDHSGLLPKLYRQGFTGKVYTTEATRDLLEFMLPDSAFIQETEVKQLNRRNAQRGLPEVEPIYTNVDAEACLAHIDPVKRNVWIDLPGGVRARFWNAGHILGSSSIELRIPDGDGRGVGILFSGDLGPDNKKFYADPESPHDIDYVVVESTYGGRPRGKITIDDRRDRLRQELLDAVDAGGNILIPSFAVERTQEVLQDIDWLIEHNKIPEMRVFIDSPLATKVTSVFDKYKDELKDLSGNGEPFRGRNIHYTQSVEDSKALNRIKSGAIIMSASGMCEAGRIRHHLRNNLWNAACTVLFVGYQAEGTLGHFIQSGQKKVRIHGEEVDVHARIRSIESYSAHADQLELVDWVRERLPVHKNIFLTHGVDESRKAMKQKLAEGGIAAEKILLPMIDDVFRLDAGTCAECLPGEAPRLQPEEMTATDWHNDYAQFVLDLAAYLRGMKDAKARRGLLRDLAQQIGAAGRKDAA